jgi:hypothetical protein
MADHRLRFRRLPGQKKYGPLGECAVKCSCGKWLGYFRYGDRTKAYPAWPAHLVAVTAAEQAARERGDR